MDTTLKFDTGTRLPVGVSVGKEVGVSVGKDVGIPVGNVAE